MRRVMQTLGFACSAHQPSVCVNKEKDMIVVVHVDDFLISGGEKDLAWFSGAMHEHFDLSETVIGRELKDLHEVRYLNRILRWETDNTMSYEGDPKHVGILLKEWGLSERKPTRAPTTRELVDRVGCGAPLAASDGTRVRRAIARLNYMAQDRPDLSFVARELSRYMAVPTDGTRKALEHALKYLRGQPRCVQKWKADLSDEDFAINVFSDSDWASDVATRRSVSGGFVQLGPVVVGHWSKSQTTVALSSAEAEFNAVVKALIEGIAICNLMEELWGAPPLICLHTDASACKGMLLRTGTGRMKHLTTKQLWAQGAVASYGVHVVKIGRLVNSEDALTHQLGTQQLHDHLRRVGFRFG